VAGVQKRWIKTRKGVNEFGFYYLAVKHMELTGNPSDEDMTSAEMARFCCANVYEAIRTNRTAEKTKGKETKWKATSAIAGISSKEEKSRASARVLTGGTYPPEWKSQEPEVRTKAANEAPASGCRKRFRTSSSLASSGRAMIWMRRCLRAAGGRLRRSELADARETARCELRPR